MTITSAVDIDNLDHDPALAVALGNLVVTWARAEGEMVRAFAAVCGISVNHAHFGYYRIPTFEARTKVIRSLLGEWKTTKYHPAAIADAIGNLSRLSKARNDFRTSGKLGLAGWPLFDAVAPRVVAVAVFVTQIHLA